MMSPGLCRNVLSVWDIGYTRKGCREDKRPFFVDAFVFFISSLYFCSLISDGLMVRDLCN